MNGEWFRSAAQELRSFMRAAALLVPKPRNQQRTTGNLQRSSEVLAHEPHVNTDAEEYSETMKRFFATWGKRSGEARMKKLTPEQRSEIARKGRPGTAAAEGRRRKRMPNNQALQVFYGTVPLIIVILVKWFWLGRMRGMEMKIEAPFEMANLFPKHTGLPFVVWISYRGGARHDVARQGVAQHQSHAHWK